VNNNMKPIQLDFKPSIRLTLVICMMGLGAGAILILPAWIWQIKLLLCLLIFSAVIYSVCQHGLLLLPWSCVGLRVGSSNQLQLVRRDGNVLLVDVCRDSVVTPCLTVINCKVQDAKFLVRLFSLHLLIMPDMLDAECYRQLRVWLRWGRVA